MDWSTIDVDALKRLWAYRMPGGYHLQEGTGNGCFLDPPGYPTYFTRCVYNRDGNNPPPDQPQMVIEYEGVLCVVDAGDKFQLPGNTWADMVARRDALMRHLWQPLSMDHPRVRAWIRSVYAYFAGGYMDDRLPEGERNRADRIVYCPPLSHELQHFRDDSRFSEEWRMAEKARVVAHNADLWIERNRICVPENHRAYRFVREFYPEHVPALDLIESGPAWGRGGDGDWWEIEAERPTPETCRPPRGSHPTGGDWCQWCGRTAEEG